MKARLLLALLISAASPTRAAIVNDVSQINPVAVARIVAPRSVEEVRRLVRESPGPVSIGGARHSMGGQIATEQALFLDMRGMDHVLAFSPERRTITVEAGITWRKIQETIDPFNLALKIMQSYADFTVGGSLSVNCHGRYVNQGPLINSVESIQLVLADGRLVEASPKKNPDIFYGAIGGYGALGVIVAATLELAPNERLERRSERLKISEYGRYFAEHIRGSKTAVFHNADIYPPGYDTIIAITFSKTDREVTVPERLHPLKRRYWLSRFAYFWISEVPFGKRLRSALLDPLRLRGRPVVWRNYEASYDVHELEPYSRRHFTYILEEYFVPVDRLGDFVSQMAAIFERHRANVINVSIRHSSRDPGSLMAWARKECFAFVVYYQQGTSQRARAEVGAWTRELIDAVLSVGGTYYLPYQLHATDEQFRKAYPRAGEFFALKRRLDPTYKFRNKLLERYFPPPPPDRAAREEEGLRKKLLERKGYLRPGDQSYLTMPEWYIVYSADEYARFLRGNPPSRFPYFGSIRQFWHIDREASRAVRGRYPYNWGCRVMIWTIGASFTEEYALKGLYEKTMGRFTEWASHRGSAEDSFMAQTAQEYASFIHATPWYEFPFATKLRAFRRLSGPRTLRGLERRLAFSIELALKAVWGKLIKKATRAAYDPAELKTQAWVRGDPAEPGVRVLERLGPHGLLAALPRYEGFKAAATALAKKKVRFVEIAGNREIVLTVIAPSAWDGARVWGDEVFEWPVLTEPGKRRVALVIPVARLNAALTQLAKEVEIDHVYDY